MTYQYLSIKKTIDKDVYLVYPYYIDMNKLISFQINHHELYSVISDFMMI